MFFGIRDPGSGIRDPRSGIRDPGWEKTRIRDKHPGSATLGKITRGIIKGNRQGVCAMSSNIVNLYIRIMLLCVCG
jgi:hypothetical protein